MLWTLGRDTDGYSAVAVLALSGAVAPRFPFGPRVEVLAAQRLFSSLRFALREATKPGMRSLMLMTLVFVVCP